MNKHHQCQTNEVCDEEVYQFTVSLMVVENSRLAGCSIHSHQQKSRPDWSGSLTRSHLWFRFLTFAAGIINSRSGEQRLEITPILQLLAVPAENTSQFSPGFIVQPERQSLDLVLRPFGNPMTGTRVANW